MSKNAPQVLLYSTTLHTWEVWALGRPVAKGSLASLHEEFPHLVPHESQLELERNDVR